MNDDEKIEKFTNTLLKTNRTYDYFVCWGNIILENFEIEICAINCLIKKKDDDKFKQTFYQLLHKTPSVILLFPYLMALGKAERESLLKSKTSLEIIKDISNIRDTDNLFFDKEHMPKNDSDIGIYYDFFCKVGLKNLYQNILQTNTYDYIIGILVGLDSNGRKNRGGELFEKICESYIKDISKKYNLILLQQKSLKEIKKYRCKIPTGLKNKKPDFILINKEKQKCMNIEVNFYNGTGSKPEEIIDSYITRANRFVDSGNSFTLITDGFKCWNGAQNQIKRGFEEIKNIINFSFLQENVLDEIVRKELL